MKINTPYLSFSDVKKKIDSFRDKYEILKTFPVDIDTFLECDLELEIVPFVNLRERTASEAILSLDFKTIYVDNEYFSNDTSWNRVKFSLAHEIGHFVLHKDFFEKQNIKNEEDWFDFMSSLAEQASYCFLEYHANWFAGMLLVPACELIHLFQKEKKPTIPSLTRHFGVSKAVIERRIEAEDARSDIEKIIRKKK